MASVEQRETCTSISETLEFFDHFKTVDEDKDSDEESFHLPLLDCEDESHNSKDQADETEDDILNKFEGSGTPDVVDPKIEEIILNDDLDDANKKSENEVTCPVKNISESLESDKTHDSEDQKANADSDIKETSESQINDSIDKLDENTLVQNESKREEDEFKHSAKEMVNKLNDNVEKNTEDSKDGEFKQQTDQNITAVVEEEFEKSSDIADKKTENETVMEIDEQPQSNEEISNKIDKENTEEDVSENVDENKLTLTNGDREEACIVEDTDAIMDGEHMDIDEKEKSIDLNRKDTSDECSTHIESSITDNTKLLSNVVCLGDQINDVEEKVDTPDDEQTETSKDTLFVENCANGESESQVNSNVTVSEEENFQNLDANKENDVNGENKVKEIVEIVNGENSSVSVVNEESRSDSLDKNEHLERDDLLDISIIRDVDEDNAKAVADHANEAQNSDKSDNDEQDEDKADNDIEESEPDQDENLVSSDKDDNMDYDDGTSSNLCIEDSSTNDVTNENTDDSTNKDSENVDDNQTKFSEEEAVTDSNDSFNRTLTNEKPDSNFDEPLEEREYLDLDKHMSEQAKLKTVKSTETLKENFPQTGAKRSLTSDDLLDVSNKKLKLSSYAKDANKNDTSSNSVGTLIDFWKYMKSKSLKNKLTRSDLEQFCLQKICEFIIHKTDVGELHQIIKKQENHIDLLRKDVQQLTKQCRDLDIVNKKLTNELKVQNANKKPLVPLKITRSVGLQVKLNTTLEQNRRSKNISTTPSRPNNTTTVNSTSSTTTTTSAVRTRVVPVSSTVVRQVTSTASSRKPSTAPTTTVTTNSNPILSQVLQNNSPRAAPTSQPSTAQKRTPVRKVAEPTKQTGSGNPGVIDLTDEDDKTAKSTTGTPVKILTKTVQMIGQPKVQVKGPASKTVNGTTKTVVAGKTIQTPGKGTPVRTVTTLPQGVRLSNPVKNGITIPASVVTSSATGTPQVMYVVQPSQLVTGNSSGGQKTVLLNIPGNSILTSALNGSAVSVIPTKTTNTVQLKTVATIGRKHPAPLPLSPYIPTSPLLKPLLPKPHLSIRKTDTGIILQWRMPYNLDQYEAIASYQLFAYQETNSPPNTDMWRKVGDVKALALPMACTLTQFADKNKYYFAVRSVDVHKRIGAFSDPEEISL